jgi:hypothetical protein
METQGNVWHVHAAKAAVTVEGCVLVEVVRAELPTVKAGCADKGTGRLSPWVRRRNGSLMFIRKCERKGLGVKLQTLGWWSEPSPGATASEDSARG